VKTEHSAACCCGKLVEKQDSFSIEYFYLIDFFFKKERFSTDFSHPFPQKNKSFPQAEINVIKVCVCSQRQKAEGRRQRAEGRRERAAIRLL
jgi:hypothetical protein